MPSHCFCETVRDAGIRQPANTASGLAFVIVAIAILKSRAVGLTKFSRIIYALATLIVGLGTIFYHASLTFWGQTADVLGMYLIATFLVIYNLVRAKVITERAAAWLYVTANAVLLAGLIVLPQARRYVFAALILGALLLELPARRREAVQRNARFLQAAAGCLALGFALWTLDITGRVCWPDSWLQGHALWHLAGAFSLWFVYRYYHDVRSPPLSLVNGT
jgi:hypothetical protein